VRFFIAVRRDDSCAGSHATTKPKATNPDSIPIVVRDITLSKAAKGTAAKQWSRRGSLIPKPRPVVAVYGPAHASRVSAPSVSTWRTRPV
jgi:hypothetical protein